MLRLGDLAPDFEAACWFPSFLQAETPTIRFRDFCTGSWVVLFSHPADFTPVCTTELARLAVLREEWEARKVKVVALSTDSIEAHAAWVKDIEAFAADNQTDAEAKVWYPIVADVDLRVSRAYGMLDAQSASSAATTPILTIRTVFVLDPLHRVRLMLSYPAAVGRNFDELLRAIDALQRADSWKVALPVDWQPGQDAIVRVDVSAEEATRLFGSDGVREWRERPYLRFTSDPKMQ
jgi:alkyl hydroperoxide reductase subunit AhpC